MNRCSTLPVAVYLRGQDWVYRYFTSMYRYRFVFNDQHFSPNLLLPFENKLSPTCVPVSSRTQRYCGLVAVLQSLNAGRVGVLVSWRPLLCAVLGSVWFRGCEGTGRDGPSPGCRVSYELHFNTCMDTYNS